MDVFKNIDEIDESATRKRAIRMLEQARFARIMGYEEQEPSVTMNYEPREYDGPNTVSNDTEKTAIRNVELQSILRRVYGSLTILDNDERNIIERYYLGSVRVPDMLLFHELHMSRRNYYRVKKRALLKIAHAMNVVVFKRDERKDVYA